MNLSILPVNGYDPHLPSFSVFCHESEGYPYIACYYTVYHCTTRNNCLNIGQNYRNNCEEVIDRNISLALCLEVTSCFCTRGREGRDYSQTAMWWHMQKFYIYLRGVFFILCIYIYTTRPESLGQDEMNRSCWIDVPIGQDSHWPFSDPVIEKAGTSNFIVKFVLLHIHKMRPALSSRTYTMCVTQWKTTKRGWCMHVAVHVDVCVGMCVCYPLGNTGAFSCCPGASTCRTEKCCVTSCMSS